MRKNRPETSTRSGVDRAEEQRPAPTVLVVEDEVLIRFAVCDYLRECGYRVLEASTGEEAQALFKAGEQVEILFTDIDLGKGMNGFALARWVREHHQGVRVILASGVAKMAEDAGDLCGEPFLHKPYPHQELADHIKRLLGASAHKGGLG